jgi:tetratricopeptide (TPR) repeat protein
VVDLQAAPSARAVIREPMIRKILRPAVIAVLGALALSIVYIPGGQFAVRESHGGVATLLGPGIHLRVPLYHRLFRYDSAPVTLDQPLEIVTKDKASFRLPVTISVWASRGDLLTFHRGRTGREPRLYLEERVRDAVLAAARQLNADEILTPDAERRLAPAVSAELITRGIADDGLRVGRPAPQVIFNAVVDYLRRKFPASARRLAERALAENPNEALNHAAMGMVLEAEGQAAAAEQAYLEALYHDPASLEPMSRLYVMYQFTKDHEKVRRLERLLTASLAKNKDTAIHHDWLGQVYLRMGKMDQAELAFQTAMALAPKEPEFRISMAGLKLRQGKIEEARALYDEALALRPEHPLALYDLGVTYAMQGQLDKAIEFFHRAERAGPPSFALFNSIAQAYEQKGSLDHAAEYLRRSLALKPNQPDRREALKTIEARQKKTG